MMPYFKNITLEPARVAALIFAVLAVAAQFGLHLSDPQLESIKNLVSILVTFFGAAELSRSKTTPLAPVKAPSVPPALVLCFLLVGCATARDAAVQTLNASADFAKVDAEIDAEK